MDFQIVTSKKSCEKTSADLPKPDVLAISILAASYLKFVEAAGIHRKFTKHKGDAVGTIKDR